MKLKAHLFRHDAEVPPDSRGHLFCTCGARDDHERHTLPAAPQQAAHHQRYEHDDEGGE